MPEATLLDSASIQGQSVAELMVHLLTTRARIREGGEFGLSFGEARIFLEEAIQRHNDEYTWDTLPAKERPAVLLLAWKTVCFVRATEIGSHQFSVTGQQGSSNPAERFNYLMQLVEKLEKEYETLCDDIGVASDDVTVGTIIRVDKLTDWVIPYNQHTGPTASTLAVTASGATQVDLVWTQEAVPGFFRYSVFYDTSPGLEDLTTLNEANPTHYGITSSASLLSTITAIHKTALRVTDLEAGQLYYFVVQTMDSSKHVSLSNEVEIVL